MIQKLSRELAIKFAFLFLITAAFATCSNILGQCDKPVSNRVVFRAVSDQYREKLTQRVRMFLQKKCEENMGEYYEMMISSFRQSNRKDDFINDMKTYYSGKDRFVSFTPTKVSEFKSSKDNIVSFWFIEGCIVEVINGKKRSKETILEAYIQGEEIYFTDVTTRPNQLGNNEKCER